MKLADLAAADLETSHGLTGRMMLTPAEALPSAVQAARFYGAYGRILSLQPDPYDPYALKLDPATITADTEITTGEWAIIAPLFRLYLERENAQPQEASRQQGAELHGRSTSEIEGDITVLQNEMPYRAFVRPVRVIRPRSE